MKILLFALVFVVVCLVLFVVGVFSPRRSRRMQQGVDEVTERAESKAEENAGRLGDATASALDRMQKGADKAAEKGREIHHDVSSS